MRAWEIDHMIGKEVIESRVFTSWREAKLAFENTPKPATGSVYLGRVDGVTLDWK